VSIGAATVATLVSVNGGSGVSADGSPGAAVPGPDDAGPFAAASDPVPGPAVLGVSGAGDGAAGPLGAEGAAHPARTTSVAVRATHEDALEDLLPDGWDVVCVISRASLLGRTERPP